MPRGRYIGKIFVLLLLLLILILGGLLWFDYLGVIKVKSLFAPVYSLLGMPVQSSETQNTNANDSSLTLVLEDERFTKRMEAIELLKQELVKEKENVALVQAENKQIAEKLQEQQLSQEEREKTFNNLKKMYDDRNVNIEKNAKNLNNMRPNDAVEILNAMSDQDVIDTLRKVDELAVAEKKLSQVPNWLSLMPPDRVAEIQRKMVSKPQRIE